MGDAEMARTSVACQHQRTGGFDNARHSLCNLRYKATDTVLDRASPQFYETKRAVTDLVEEVGDLGNRAQSSMMAASDDPMKAMDTMNVPREVQEKVVDEISTRATSKPGRIMDPSDYEQILRKNLADYDLDHKVDLQVGGRIFRITCNFSTGRSIEVSVLSCGTRRPRGNLWLVIPSLVRRPKYPNLLSANRDKRRSRER